MSVRLTLRILGGLLVFLGVMLRFKHAFLQLSVLIHPREVRSLKLNHKPVSREVIQSVLGFFALLMTVFLAGSVIMAGLLPANTDGNADLLTAGTSALTALGNIGPPRANPRWAVPCSMAGRSAPARMSAPADGR